MPSRHRGLLRGLLCLVWHTSACWCGVLAGSPSLAAPSPGLAALLAEATMSDMTQNLLPLQAATPNPVVSYLGALALGDADTPVARFRRSASLSSFQAVPMDQDKGAVPQKTDQQAAMQTAAKAAALNKDTQKAADDAARNAGGAAAAAAKPPILLIHGGAQGGWAWSYPSPEQGAPEGVAGLLRDAGFTVYTPTLPYHEPGTGWSPSQGQLQAQDYVDYLTNFMVAERISGAVVVAHSLSGVWAQLLLGAAPERIARMVFLNAVLLKNGESFVSNAVGPAQLFFSMLFTYPSFPQLLSTPAGQIDLHVWKKVMVNCAADNDTFAVDTYSKLVPEPAGPQLEYPDFTAFYTTPMPKFFIFEEDDVSLLLGKNRWLDFADRLHDANNGVGNSTVIAVHGDHQGMLTRPASISAGIVEAAIMPLQQSR